MAELKNLNTLKTQTETKFHSNFSYADRRLPVMFKELITKFDNDKITYNEYSFEVQRSSEGIIVAPNQWLYIAAYYSSYCREMFAYKQELVNYLLTQYSTKKAFEEPIRKCQNNIEEAKTLLASYPEGNNKDYLIKFLSDYSWWGGAKTIDRSDFCASAILSSANLVNATQSYVADICEFLAENPDAENILLTASENSERSSFINKKYNLDSCQDNQNYLAAIRTKPFLLLAGISGTGKSRIVRELAFKSCPKYLQDKDGTTPGNYCMIEVKPNWHDSTELLGYYSNLNMSYQFKKFVKFLVKAKMNPEVPFFVCLDEMNLAPVEQYFAEILSIMETRKHPMIEGRNETNKDIIKTGAIIDSVYFEKYTWKGEDGERMERNEPMSDRDWYFEFFNQDTLSEGEKKQADKYKDSYTLGKDGLTLPDNVIIIGTVNMDDTTHQFSRKVIDRAMTIEMNGGKLSNMFGGSKDLEYLPKEEQEKWQNSFRQRYVNADEVLEAHPDEAEDIVKKVPDKLENINKALKGTPFEVSYRVLNELTIMVGVLLDSKKEGENLDDIINQALDHILLMKILPRIEGDSDMFNLSKDFKQKNNVEYNNRLEWLMDLAPEIKAEEKDHDDHRQTAREKIKEMIERLENQEFTRFWP